MSRSILGRVTGVLFLFYVIGFAVLLVYSFATFTAQKVLPSFQWDYVIRRAFLLFTGYLIPIHVSGIVVAFSFGARRKGQAPGDALPFSRIVSSTLVTFLVLGIGYTVLEEGLAPAASRRVADMEYQSTLARQFLVQATTYRERGDYQTALGYAQLYLLIDKKNTQVSDLKLNLEGQAARQKSTRTAAPETAPKVPPGLSATSLMNKARYYFDREDWYSAHYYATQASQVEPGRSDALRIAAMAWDKITEFTLPRGDVAAAELYGKKKQAYQELMGGRPFAAYYGFLALSGQFPKDKDVAEYLEASRKAIGKESFFADEAKGIVALPGVQDLLFMNGREDGGIEAVSARKMVETADQGTYFLDIEAVRFRPDGSIVFHLKAPYGKRVENVLLLHAIDSRDPRTQYLPLYLSGTRDPGERNFLTVRPNAEELRALAAREDGLSRLGLPQLWRMKGTLKAYGVMADRISLEIVMKALMPFVFLTLSLLGVSFGWAFRARYLGKPSLFSLLLVPLVPLVVSLLALLWIYAHRVILGFTVLAFGLGAALAVCAGLELVILAVSLVLLSGQTSGQA